KWILVGMTPVVIVEDHVHVPVGGAVDDVLAHVREHKGGGVSGRGERGGFRFDAEVGMTPFARAVLVQDPVHVADAAAVDDVLALDLKRHYSPPPRRWHCLPKDYGGGNEQGQ